MSDVARCTNPECVPIGRDGKARPAPALETIESNVSGCGFDMAYCPVCHREYLVYYKVDRVARMDPDTGEEMK